MKCRLSPIMLPCVAAFGAATLGCVGRQSGWKEPLSAPTTLPASRPTVPRLADAVAAAERAGAGKAARLAESILFEGERLGAFVAVPADECVLVLARGVGTVSDLDLVLWSDEGEWLAGDERRDAEPSVFLCPPHPARVHAMGVLASGRGAVSLSAQRVARADEAGVRAWLAASLSGSEPGEARAERRLVHANPDVPTLVPFELEAGACAEVRAAGHGATSEPDLVLVDGGGVVIKRGPPTVGDRAALQFCAREVFHGQLAVRSRLGQGDVLVTVRRASRATWAAEGRRLEDLATPRSLGVRGVRQGAIGAGVGGCRWVDAPVEGLCTFAVRGSFGDGRLPAAVCAGEGELVCDGPAGSPSVRDVRVNPSDFPLELHAALLERGLEHLGSLPDAVLVLVGRGGETVSVAAPAMPGVAKSLVVVRSAARRFSVRAAEVDGPVRHQASGIGSVVLEVAPSRGELIVEALGLEPGEAFLVLVAQ